MLDYSLTPEEHFKLVYRCKVEQTNERVMINPFVPLAVGTLIAQDEVRVQAEPVIAVKMAESDYKKFVRGYSDYIALMYAMEDPIARDMFEKLMIYIRLKA